MPLRSPASSVVGFQRIVAPAKVLKRRVLIGWYYKLVVRHGHVVKKKVGGHLATIRLVIPVDQRCSHKRIKTGPHRWKQINVCREIHVIIDHQHQVGHGQAVKLYGLVTSSGVPIAGARVAIYTAPESSGHHFGKVAVVQAGANGSWSYKLAPGPSRIIRALYGGTGRILPAAGEAMVLTPARISASITPTVLPWSGTIHLTGRLLGGYIPRDGVPLRLLAYPYGRVQTLFAFRTTRKGAFSTTWSYNSGTGVAKIKLAVATIGTGSDYPWTPTHTRPLIVTFGIPTPTRRGG